jgi:SHAQKYF class myb-like DNA-binding protein
MNKNAWTQSEHTRFLLGLQIYGPGKWAKISKKYVLTRSPTQVASHAQKYHARLVKVGRRRKSIFDPPTVHRPIATYPTKDWYKKYCIK